MKIPPCLKPGDTIAIVCPAGYMPAERAAICIETLQTWGYKVRVGHTVGGPSDNYFSGTDDQRLAEFQQMLDDPDITAILCGRGGYGLTRIIDRIDFSTFAKAPKWIAGFSDITILHTHIWSNYKIVTLHSPMAGAFNDGGADDVYVRSLRKALNGEKAAYECAPHPFNRTGTATGRLVGGNLSLIAHLTGTVSDMRTKGKILFLEDVGEYRYNIDRMLHQLKRSGKLDRLEGLVIGGFTDSKDTTRPFGATVEEIIRDVISEYDYPVCFGFPVSHDRENYTLKIGVQHTLDITPEKITLKE
ncbi:S66 peptidase family protein [Puia sp. P3]|uniref:S66 peptidase family protein n=1 Tax=Puia sp. P3 TaxID=3423952 RepID=UPI003D679834